MRKRGELMGRNFLDRFTDGFDLPGEPVPGQSVVEICGQHRVLIEHHQGVCQYSREKICVKVKFGTAAICGSGLELTRMSKEQLVICGRIDGITLYRREKR